MLSPSLYTFECIRRDRYECETAKKEEKLMLKNVIYTQLNS